MKLRPHITPVLVLAGLLVASGSARAVPGDRQEKEEKAPSVACVAPTSGPRGTGIGGADPVWLA